MRRLAVLAVLALIVVAGCKSTGDSGGTGSTGTTGPATGPSPGVTDDSIQIGITYNDLSSIREITKIDLGDDKASYQAIIDDINAKGGINGRKLVPTYAAVSPVGTTSADEACLKLTEDTQSFIVVGYFQADQVMCYVDTHATAALGGTMTPERQANAKAPWFTTEPGSAFEEASIKMLAEKGELDGKLGVVATTQGDQNMKDQILPQLQELNVPVVESAVIDAPDNDASAQKAAVASIAERFRSEGIDKVLLTGESGLTWASGVQDSTYRPEMVFSTVAAIRAYTTGAGKGKDLSMLNTAVAGGTFESPSDQIPSDPLFLECLKTQEAAGLKVLPPDQVRDTGSFQIAATSGACRNMSLLTQMLEAAGPDLNYGTLVQGAETLQGIKIAGTPDPWTFGSGVNAQGNPTAYLWTFDQQKQEFVPPA